MVKTASLNPVADALGFNATETGASKDVSDRTQGSTWCVLVTVPTAFVGTILVEGSNDGVNWAPMGAGLTAAGVLSSATAVRVLRARCSAFTSGAAFADLAYDVPTK